MNGLPNLLGYAGYVVGVMAAVSAYINRDRYKTLINDIYKPGNQELREQLATSKAEITELTSQKSTLEGVLAEKNQSIKKIEELNSRLPDYTALTEATNRVITTMSDNHAKTMKAITELSKKMVK